MNPLPLNLVELYETDFNLWLEQTIQLLKTQQFQHLDLAHLIEELEGLGKRDKRELENRLTTLFEHALKRCFTDLTQDYRGWTDTIRRNQKALKKLLADMPSLKNYFQQVQDQCYQEALILLRENPDYQKYDLPKQNPFPADPDRLLNESFWER